MPKRGGPRFKGDEGHNNIAGACRIIAEVLKHLLRAERYNVSWTFILVKADISRAILSRGQHFSTIYSIILENRSGGMLVYNYLILNKLFNGLLSTGQAYDEVVRRQE